MLWCVPPREYEWEDDFLREKGGDIEQIPLELRPGITEHAPHVPFRVAPAFGLLGLHVLGITYVDFPDDRSKWRAHVIALGPDRIYINEGDVVVLVSLEK
jgi:hypothetical protein